MDVGRTIVRSICGRWRERINHLGWVELFRHPCCFSEAVEGLVLLSSHILHRGAYMWRKMRYASDNLSLFIDYMFDFLYIFGTFYFLKIGVQNVMGRAAT
ncbi:hypothetical protein BRADI_4g23978v3 [Brachypodium distachyon]|uniref:Uncharacterized protein n=1 Tax=Brachypodium distachyon TaxID=15368 RepID=A0A2K2CPW0_BRADI|nr:hypothetical protein BRADI_4g23978v3 [Brachypodium distachyon]